jgi:very-short-patch-repair endonuclease
MRRLLFQSPGIKFRRQELRNNATVPEKQLWERLRKRQLGYKFTRQYSVGNYILDFYCPEKKLGLEIDGEIHNQQKEKDEYRTRTIKELGIKIARFNNSEIENDINSILNKLKSYLI